MTWSASTRLITFSGVVPDESSYIVSPAPIVFQLSGFTNPATSSNAYFVWTSYCVLSDGTFMIDQISSMYVSADQGECVISEFYPTDDNYMIYGVASNWTATLTCEHLIGTDYSIRMTFPSDWYVVETSSCDMGEQNSVFSCVSDNSDGTITVTEFLDEELDEETEFTFTIDSIRNPTVTGTSYSI